MFPARIPIVSSPPSAGFSTQSVSFDGSNDYVAIGDVHDISADADFSLSLWVKTSEAGNYGTLVGKGRFSGTLERYALYYSGSVGRLNLCDGSASGKDLGSSTSIVDGEWHHILGTFDRSGDMTIYIDGTAEGTSDISAQTDSLVPGDSYDDFVIGGGQSGMTYSQALIDEVSIFNTIVSVGDLRDGSKPADLTDINGLVGWWRMGDGTEAASGTTIYDMSTNSNNGTLTNGPTYSTDVAA